MAVAVRSLAFIVLTTALAACSGKPAATTADAAAVAGASSSGSAGNYQGVPVYAGMTELMSRDTPAAPGATLHSGSYRSNDGPEQIRAYYHEQLGKLYGGVVSDDALGDGMIRLVAGSGAKTVTILIHPGDSGGQVVGIQVIARD